jgi:hypothetical protein
VLSRQVATSPTQRDHHLLAIERGSRFDWKRASGYYDQAYAENVFSHIPPDFVVKYQSIDIAEVIYPQIM